jgi:hypothetical protein
MLLLIDWIGKSPLTMTLQAIGFLLLFLMAISKILPRVERPRVTYAEEFRERLRKRAANE